MGSRCVSSVSFSGQAFTGLIRRAPQGRPYPDTPPYPLTLSISRRMTLLACGFLAVSESSAWEIWAAGASHAGGSSSPGHSAAVVPVNSVGLLGSPYSQIWDPVAGPGRTPMPRNNSGRSHLGNGAVSEWVGRLGSEGFWVGEYGGSPSRSPFWRTPEESGKGLGSVSLKINTQHTQ